ncbi:MAG: GNAT family N-acetyltransferase [Ruminococcaceae bacterium]|nr:GNAT family N-acetyltransferase [Oscillospiraceae bacterium]
MITKIDTKTATRLLGKEKDVLSLKIGGNLKAYQGYDFCSFYAGKDVFIGRYYDDFVVRTKGGLSDEEMEELSLFLKMCGFKQAICSLETGKRLELMGWDNCFESMQFGFSTNLIPETEKYPDFSELEENPPLDSVFEILKEGFPDLNYESWYTDINHKIRHDVSKVYVYNGATATVMADMNDSVFIALLASKKEARGTGAAKNLLRGLGAHFEKQGKETSILCREELIPFYKKAGFYECGKTVTIKNI